MTDQDVSGGNAVDKPKNDYVVQDKEQVKASEVKAEEPKKAIIPEEQVEDQDQGEGKKSRRGGWQRKIEKLESELAALRANKTEQPKIEKPAEPAKDDEPKPDDYKSWDDYNRALVKWEAKETIKQALDDRDKKAEEKSKADKARTERQTQVERYEDGIEKAREVHEDFDEIIENYDGPLTNEMQRELLASDVGPEIAYYLAKPENRKLAEDISKMTVGGMIKEFGRIEAKLEKSPVTPAVKTTKAPQPITPVKQKSSGTLEFREGMPYEDFKRWEKTQR